eukprot:6204484-Pleurochrysis_carterae.AAC.2
MKEKCNNVWCEGFSTGVVRKRVRIGSRRKVWTDGRRGSHKEAGRDGARIWRIGANSDALARVRERGNAARAAGIRSKTLQA